jgi:hypothetical protein
MTQKQIQPQSQPSAKEVNRTYHWQQPSAIIRLKPTFLPTLQLSWRIPIQQPQIPFTILPAMQLHSTGKPSQHNQTNHHLSFATSPNNISHSQLRNNSTKNRAQPTTTSTTKPRVFATRHQFPNLQNHPHYHQRLQPKF